MSEARADTVLIPWRRDIGTGSIRDSGGWEDYRVVLQVQRRSETWWRTSKSNFERTARAGRWVGGN